MGASKRLAEMALQSLSNESKNFSTCLCIVRFGNVLGSSGSVVPLFRKQIESGGPITVTDENVTRYFMTIKEASQLVIQAGAMANGGEVFVLDMGQPIRIVDLARNMIEAVGLGVKDEITPWGDISIVFTGLRPGEKLYEELLIGKDVQNTKHPRILQAKESFLSRDKFNILIGKLREALNENDVAAICNLLINHVAGYTPSQELNAETSKNDLRKIKARKVY